MLCESGRVGRIEDTYVENKTWVCKLKMQSPLNKEIRCADHRRCPLLESGQIIVGCASAVPSQVFNVVQVLARVNRERLAVLLSETQRKDVGEERYEAALRCVPFP